MVVTCSLSCLTAAMPAEEGANVVAAWSAETRPQQSLRRLPGIIPERTWTQLH